jgi:GNAT superfamily N-acetyltransferase
MSKLRVETFQDWCPRLDEALSDLPEMEGCSHELYRRLVQIRMPKHIALVRDGGTPVAIVGLRRTDGWRRWQPITNLIVPAAVCPSRPDYLVPSIAAVDKYVNVRWWYERSPVPQGSSVHAIKTRDIYCAQFPFDSRAYWRQSGHLNTVNQKRKKCAKFSVSVNPPGGREWTIRSWKKFWGPNEDGSDLECRLAAAEHLEREGRHYTLVMFDGEKPVAGHTLVSHNKNLIWQVTYRDQDYDRVGVGTALMAEVFEFAERVGAESLDLGGEHDYKAKWAPLSRTRAELTICPNPKYAALQLPEFAQRAAGYLRRRTVARLRSLRGSSRAQPH